MDNNSDILLTNSQKSYFVAVCLAGIFGTLGMLHFYLGRWLHGTFDLAMVILTIIFIFFSSQLPVGNQQKWDTFVKEKSGGNGGVVGLQPHCSRYNEAN
jgi:O-antigen/teichoic acid export membrane protein